MLRGRCAAMAPTDGWVGWADDGTCWATGTSAGCWLIAPFFRAKDWSGASERAVSADTAGFIG